MSKCIELEEFEKVFLGTCFGVGLSWRGPNDKHVCFTILTEDDGSWFASDNSASSAWLPECIQVIQEAYDWVKKHCKPDKYKGIQCGWKFKA